MQSVAGGRGHLVGPAVCGARGVLGGRAPADRAQLRRSPAQRQPRRAARRRQGHSMDGGRPLLRLVVLVVLLLLLRQELLREPLRLRLLRGGRPTRAHLLLRQRSSLAVRRAALCRAAGHSCGWVLCGTAGTAASGGLERAFGPADAGRRDPSRGGAGIEAGSGIGGGATSGHPPLCGAHAPQERQWARAAPPGGKRRSRPAM